MRWVRWLCVAAAVGVTGTHTNAAEVRVLSAGAVEPGVRAAIARFEHASGDRVRVGFAAAPTLRERSARPDAADAADGYDLLIAPMAVLDAAAGAGVVRLERMVLGSVGIGVAVRPGAPVPDIATPDALKASLLAADSVVYNRASTGVLVERVVRDLGIADALAGKTTRVADGAAVMAHLLQGHGRELGLGAITEILLHKDQGLVYVGPLPGALQSKTTYAAAVAVHAADPAAVERLWRYLGSPEGLAHFRAAGID
ncbi:MAG TPA: substrate-binding domain-containing protein [Burkholderiaceae bacterium]|nr:substrate-binding domain-containing protein [Burkholderiaceae bacterium]